MHILIAATSVLACVAGVEIDTVGDWEEGKREGDWRERIR